VAKYLKLYYAELLIFAYILGNTYILIYRKDDFYAYNLIPVALIIGYIAVFHLQKLVLFLAFVTPLAITLKEMGMSEKLDMSLPSEPIMIIIMMLYIFNSLNGRISDKKFINHPITVIIIIQLVWIFITALCSVNIVVSLKFLISRLWFVFSCYVIIPHLFKDKKNMINYFFCYATGLLIVVIISTYKHAAFNFNDEAAHWIVSPFYNDHTAYGAALTMFLPVCFALIFVKNISRFLRMYALALFLAFSLGLVLSFARASWLSLVIALGILATIMLKIKFKTLFLTLLIGAGLFFTFQTEVLIALGRNNTDSEGGFSNNIESVTNISTNASNLERLNRWSCAIRMFKDKPLLGWGPGTYMFEYAPYQLSKEKTIISTNFGTNGNAHSEYLGPLTEQGVPGLLIMLTLLLYVTSLGYRLAYTVAEPEVKIIIIAVFLGLMSYLIHGFLNNFLDTDKLSLPFWSFLAALVTVDLYYPKKSPVLKS
jgi:putative inorganic carbon (HCO3(-)) transporter